MSTETALRNAVSDAVRDAQVSGRIIDVTATARHRLDRYPDAGLTMDDIRGSLQRGAVRRKVVLLVGSEAADS